MIELDDLAPVSTSARLIKGKWCNVRFSPSTGNGELLNIGVAFIPTRGKLHAKLIPNAGGFRSLYGSGGVENFAFLLTLTAEHFQRTGSMTTISPHISFGPLLPIQGESVDHILHSLYQHTVTLRLYDDRGAAQKRSMNTQTLRNNVIRLLRQQYRDITGRFLHEQPVHVQHEEQSLLLDLPIWQNEDLVSHRKFGSIVSTMYLDEIYRQHDLDRAYRNVETAKRFIEKSGSGSIFILRPASNDGEFPLRDIDNEIDAIAWPLLKSKIHVEVVESADDVRKKVANFICH